MVGDAFSYDNIKNIPIDTSKLFVYSSPTYIDSNDHRIVKRIAKLEIDPSTDIRKYYWYIFRTNDSTQIDGWNKIVRYYGNNPIIKIRFINAISKLKNRNFKSVIFNDLKNDNDIIREVAARNICRDCNDSMMKICNEWIKEEKNEYVKESVITALRKARKTSQKTMFPYLPKTYDNIPETDSLFYNVGIKQSFENYVVIEDSIKNMQLPKYDGISFPHQQYKYPLKGSPSKGVFGNNYGGIYHVGTDSGWLLEGLPIHSIGSGRVKKIQHESTWGTFVVVEGIDDRDSVYTVFYGHLDPNLDVDVGDVIARGQTIGVIGKSFTLDNGGYISHLHLGIEKSRYIDAHLKGYDFDVNRYETIEELMKKE